jgi:hypothetical protein
MSAFLTQPEKVIWEKPEEIDIRRGERGQLFVKLQERKDYVDVICANHLSSIHKTFWDRMEQFEVVYKENDG